MIVLAGAVLAGGFLLLSAAESTTLVDGAVEWHAESPLRAVVQLLCLNYRVPTINAGEIKGYLLGMGAGLGLIALGIAGLARPAVPGDAPGAEAAPLAALERPTKLHLPPLLAAQLLALLYVLWSFASSRWSAAPRLSIGGSVLLAMGFLWAFSLACALNTRAAELVSRVLMVVTGVTAVVALWYYDGRNPTLRAKFPWGNPNFLSAALLPGTLLAVATLVHETRAFIKTRLGPSVMWAIAAAAVLALSLWALRLSDSRGANLALLAGALALLFFALPGRWKVVPSAFAILAVIAATWYFVTFAGEPSPTGRGVTLRLRTYGWGYAWRMFIDRPLTGHGQGGFAMLGDSFSPADVLADPPVFESRIDHAHNEWLEVMADLGAVGLILLAAALALTVYASARVLPGLRPGARTAAIGLLGGVAALVVEESFGVGLRICELPLVFFTVLGLLWAVARSPNTESWWRRTLTPSRRAFAAVFGLLLGPAVLVANQQDFYAARQAFRTDELLQKGEYEPAIRAATLATARLYPQRVLMNYYLLAQAQVLAAEDLQTRAIARERRAQETEPPNPRLQYLAADDFRLAEEHAKAANHALKELVSAAPGYINHGQLEYRVNLLQARAAGSRGENEAAQAYAKNAAAAIERELIRQPFDPGIALDFLRLVAPMLEAPRVMDVLARPLRYHRMTDECVELLRDLAREDTFSRSLRVVLEDAEDAPAADPQGEAVETWAPEKIRLGATLEFLRGEYASAVRQLEQAALRYERMNSRASIGAAGCYAELADCRFFADPDHPQAAIDDAARAIELAPDSRPGRELRTGVRQRLVHYQLAAGNEAEARRILRELAPASIQTQVLDIELATRYRRLCESLLQRREVQSLRKPADAMIAKLTAWLQRAMELHASDPVSHLVAADLALYGGNDAKAAEHLENALRYGLAPAEVERFLEMALSRSPQSAALQAVRAKLASPGSRSPEAPRLP